MNIDLVDLLLIFTGGAAGGMVRTGLDHLLRPRTRSNQVSIPWGTLVANVAGTLGLGVLTGLMMAGSPGLALLGTGVCGGLTIFSAFSMQVTELMHRSIGRTVVYLLVTVLAGLVAAGGGLLAGEWLA